MRTNIVIDNSLMQRAMKGHRSFNQESGGGRGPSIADQGEGTRRHSPFAWQD